MPSYCQKQSPRDVCKKFHKIHRKTPVPESLFSDPRPPTLLKKRLWHSFFPVKFAKFLRTPFLQNTGSCFCIANIRPSGLHNNLLNFITSLRQHNIFQSACQYSKSTNFVRIYTRTRWLEKHTLWRSLYLCFADFSTFLTENNWFSHKSPFTVH